MFSSPGFPPFVPNFTSTPQGWRFSFRGSFTRPPRFFLRLHLFLPRLFPFCVRSFFFFFCHCFCGTGFLLSFPFLRFSTSMCLLCVITLALGYPLFCPLLAPFPQVFFGRMSRFDLSLTGELPSLPVLFLDFLPSPFPLIRV